MLKSLYIKNYALIDEIRIDLGIGFTAITGETGAGKSILLGALSLLLGKRADSSVIQDNTKKCIVECVFDIDGLPAASFFKKHDLDYERFTVVRREINPAGRSRAFINDTPVTLEQLKSLGENLVDIHSQHDTLRIASSSFQLNVLDDYVNRPDLMNTYQSLFEDYLRLKKKLELLKEENTKLRRDEDYIRFQFDELVGAGLIENEEEELVSREKLLKNAGEFAVDINRVIEILDEGELSLARQLHELVELLERVGRYHKAAGDLSKRVDSARIELEDISGEVAKMNELTEFNPGELDRISERLNILYRLHQKHHVNTTGELIRIKNSLEEQLEGISHLDEEIKENEELLKVMKRRVEETAEEIHNLRVEKAPFLAAKVVASLKKLGIKEASFSIALEPLSEPVPSGVDAVTFLFTANRGGKMARIDQVASGGELSRLMLAIKAQISREHLLPTIIFDEIDSGVSGEIAGKVGKILNEMSEKHQLIAITHLPQIAARAGDHFKVFKVSGEEKTKTRIERLTSAGRVEELAKLMSDENVSEAAISAAKELLN